jgi:hypothetical protein
MTRNEFKLFMQGYLKDTGNTWAIDLTTKRKASPATYGSPNYDPNWYKNGDYYNKYTLFIADSTNKVILKSDEQQGYQRNAWNSKEYGDFIRTLKKV